MKDKYLSKNERSLERYSAVSAIKQHLATGHTLSVALQLCAQQSWAGTYYSASTLEKWYYKYQQSGYDALIDKTRHDKTLRKLPAQAQEALLTLRKQNPRQTVTTLLRELEKQNILPAGSYSPSSIYRFLRDHGLDKQSLKNTIALEEQGPTKAFEKPLANELWMSDAMHGITLKTQGSKTRKTYLFAIIDDHSRLITHAQYYFSEDSASLLDTLKQALLRRGIPQSFYTDNGKPFVSNHLKEVCARLGIQLLHAKPYAAYSKGKIERFFRTLQEHFEQSLTYDPVHDLLKLNTRLWQWLETQYHNRPHSSLGNGQTPMHRYLAHTEHIKAIEHPNNIEELFYKTITRVVRKDSTISIENTLWEVNPILRGKKIQIHYNPHSQEPTHKITYENKDHGTAVKCDKHLNSHFQSQNYDY